MAIVHFKDVWEMYRIKFVIDSKASWENFWALKGISFEMEPGQTLGIIGENGAGKSTILKLIAGMLKPDRGVVQVSGRVAGLLELGAGFQSELTGKENIYLNASMFGLTKTSIEVKYDEIVNFADIGKFINAPVKCYSQGMFVRLAFAIAIHMEPDILLIDDTLAVGDEYFQRKCIKKIFEVKEQGKSIIFVTHDMNMLSRLCQRAIFLKEGKVIKDDLIDKVIPLYSQMIGTREGVGVLEKRSLELVFNNGRFFLNWQDTLLTPNSGAYAVFLVSNKWYSSLQADWEVRKEDGNKLVATGKFYQLALTQIWRLELTDNYEIKWDIDIESQDPLEIQEGYTNILLTNQYAQWFTTLEKGEFPLIDDKDKNWQALLEGNTFRKCIGVKAREAVDKTIPALAFEQTNLSYKSQSQILNSDYLASCRILQFRTLGMQNYAATQANRFIYFSGRIILDISDVDNYLQKVQDEFVLSSRKLRLTFDNGRLILSYNGVNLTKASHIGTSLYANGRWYQSNLAHWEVKKENENKLLAKGIWHNIPVVQIWELEVINEFSFLWRVNMEVNREIDIQEQYVQFLCSDSYKYYFSDYGLGKFPVESLESEVDMVQRCIIDSIIGLQSQNNQCPTISLKFSKGSDNFAKIFNSDFYNRARILRIEKMQAEQNVKFLPGHHPCFAMEVMVDEDKKVHLEDLTYILQRRKLKFLFDNGRGHIYWNDLELTKKLCLYTSLRSQGRWYDSASQAIWKVEEKNTYTIKAFGKWLHLPINQYWEIRLEEGDTIGFSVKMKVDSRIEIDRLQTNVMLSERYKQWLTSKDRGVFPEFKGDIDDDWEVLWSNLTSKKKFKEHIGVISYYGDGLSLPKVIFSPEELEPKWMLNVINSDLYHRGRILQYLNNQSKILLPGEYPYYQGKIKIEEP